MTGEIELSIEETNKLRLEVGLPPIPIEEKEEKVYEKPVHNRRESLSVAETNELRKSIGLKPIPEDDQNHKNNSHSNVYNNTSESTAHDADIRTSKLKQRLQEVKAKSRRKLHKPIIDYDATDIDVDSWLGSLDSINTLNTTPSGPKREKKKEKNSFNHETNLHQDNIGEPNEILTLEDNSILDESHLLKNEKIAKDEALQNELEEKSKLQKLKDNRYHRLDDNNDTDNNKNEVTYDDPSIPNPYKNDREGKKVEADGLFGDDQDLTLEELAPQAKPQLKMKKIKKKAMKKRERTDDEEVVIGKVTLDRLDDDEIEDDNELQSVLDTRRRLKQRKKRNNLTPEDIAREIRQSKRHQAQEFMEQDSYRTDFKGIVFDQTEEFLGSIENKVPTPNENGDGSVVQELKIQSKPVNSEIKKENEGKVPQEDLEPVDNNEESDEPQLTGLASALNFLKSRSVLHESSNDSTKSKIAMEAAKASELFRIKVSIEERLLKEELSKNSEFMKLPKDERENLYDRYLDERLSDKGIVDDSLMPTNIPRDISKSYNPQVRLSYKDDSGNRLDTKDAFKYLSHKFHGFDTRKKEFERRTKRQKKEKDTSFM